MEYIHCCSDLSFFKYFSKGHLHHPDESSNAILFIYLLEGVFILFILIMRLMCRSLANHTLAL